MTRLKDGDLMTLGDVAAALGVCVALASKLRADGRLPAVKTVGGQWIYRTIDVRALAALRRKAPRGNTLGAVMAPPP